MAFSSLVVGQQFYVLTAVVSSVRINRIATLLAPSGDASLSLSECDRGGAGSHDSLLGPPRAELRRAADLGVVFDVLPRRGAVLTAGKPDATQSATAAVRDRRQGRPTRPDQAHPAALRALGVTRGAWRFRRHCGWSARVG